MKTGERITVDILGFSTDGLGMGRALVEDREVLVSHAAPGDRVTAVIEHVSPNQPIAWARAVMWLGRGPDHAKAPCHHAAPTRGACGGCPLMHLSPDAQRRAKLALLDGALSPLGVSLSSLRSASPTLAYRNRSNFVVERTRRGRVVLGSYAPRSHEVARMSGCPILRKPLPDVAERIALVLQTEGYPVGDEHDGVRYVGVRADAEGKVLVELILWRADVAWQQALAEAIGRLPEVVGVSVSQNVSRGNAIRVEAEQTVVGRSRLMETIAGLEVEVACGTFTQLNTSVATAMADWLVARVGSPSLVWDLYCGVGVLGLAAIRGRQGARVFGVESVVEAVAEARMVASRAGLEATFLAHDLRAGLPPEVPSPDLIIANPPRRGLDPAVVDAVIAQPRATLFYMSCNPTSFATDAARLLRAGFVLAEVEAWDMLPQTAHIELMARFVGPEVATIQGEPG